MLARYFAGAAQVQPPRVINSAMTMMRIAKTMGGVLVAVGLGFSAACTGELLGASDTAATPGGDQGDGRIDPRMTYKCTPEQRQQRGQTLGRMRRLSRDEIENTFAVLLGPSIVADENLRAKLEGLPPDRTENAGDFVEEPPTALADVLYGVAKRGVELALADVTWTTANLGACAAEATPSEPCVSDALRRFGARALRRELTEEEVTDSLTLSRTAGGGTAGLSLALRRLLQSPSSVFHVELGTERKEGARVRLTAFEVAARVSYLAASEPPDAELMDAARKGELDDIVGVRKHTERLFQASRSRAKARDFMRFFVRLNIVPDPPAAAAKLAGIDDPTGLGEQMRAEALAFLDDVLTAGTYRDLMGSTKAFPRTPELARIFGVSLDGDRPVNAPAHVGILHRPALLVTSGPRTSPIVRGAHLRKLFLCESFGMPDPAAITARQEELGDIENQSNRDKTTRLTSALECAGCHSVINPVGFSFEGFDQLGAKRSVESVFDESGAVAKTWPLDTRASGTSVDREGATSFDGSSALATAMAESFTGRACMARRAFEYYRLAAADTALDGCTLQEAERKSHDGTLQDVVLAAIANEDIFWKALP